MSGFIVDNKQIIQVQSSRGDKEKITDSHYFYKCLILAEDLGQKSELPVEGTAHLPQIVVNDAEF